MPRRYPHRVTPHDVPSLPLVFCHDDLDVHEDRDYPEDPAPYLALHFKRAQVAGACKCGRQRARIDVTAQLEREDALRFAAAIVRHYQLTDGQAIQRRELDRRIRAERERLEARDAALAATFGPAD